MNSIKYIKNGNKYEDKWENIANDINISSIGKERNDYYFEEGQEISINKTINLIGSNISLDFGNCDININKIGIVNYNEGYISNGKIKVDGNIEYEENIENVFGIICNVNKNNIVNLEINGRLEYEVKKEANSVIGCVCGKNMGVIEHIKMKEIDIEIDTENNINFGIISGKSNNGITRNIDINMTKIKCRNSRNAYISGIIGESKNDIIESIRYGSIDIELKNINQCILGSIYSTSEYTNIEDIDIKESVINVEEIRNLYIGVVGGLSGLCTQMCNINITNIKSITCKDGEEYIIGGVSGYNDNGCKIRMIDINEISKIKIENVKSVKYGSISGINNGEISEIKVKEIKEIEVKDINTNDIGGIIGRNNGNINNIEIGKIEKIENLNGGYMNNVGGICGMNENQMNEINIKSIESMKSYGGMINNVGVISGNDESLNVNKLNLNVKIKQENIEAKNGIENKIRQQELVVIDGGVNIYVYDIGDDISDENILGIATSMHESFKDSTFNEYINHWNTNNITNMGTTFKNSEYNQPIDDWETGNVINMNNMFDGCIYDHDLSKISLESVTNVTNIFNGSDMSIKNGEKFLINLYNYAQKGNKDYGGSVININQEQNTYGYYVLYKLEKDYNIVNTIGVINSENINTGIDRIHILYDDGIIMRFMKDDIDYDESNPKVITYKIKLDGNYDYRFKARQCGSNQGHDLYFHYDSKNSSYRFLSHGTGNASNKRLVDESGLQLENSVSEVSSGINDSGLRVLSTRPSNFYIELELNANNDYRLQMMPYDYAYANIETKIGIISVPKIEMIGNSDINGINVLQWGSNIWMSMESMFKDSGINNVKITPYSGKPNLKYCISMNSMFKGCANFNGDIEEWNVGRVEDMSSMLEGCSNFNRSVEKWNTSKVKNMNSMFKGCTNFNQEIGTIDVSKVEDFSSMLEGCNSFENELNNLEIKAGRNISNMLPSTYDKYIGSWQINSEESSITNEESKKAYHLKNKSIYTTDYETGYDNSNYIEINIDVNCDIKYENFTNGSYEFNLNGSEISSTGSISSNSIIIKKDSNGKLNIPNLSIINTQASKANVNINVWKYANMIHYKELFKNCNITLPEYNTNSEFYESRLCESYESMFEECSITNPENLQYFNTQKIINMSRMFKNFNFESGKEYNGITTWDTSNVRDFSYMFETSSGFNENIHSWNTMSCKNMEGMFKGTIFNQSIQTWNTTQVKNMNSMFEGCTSYDQSMYWDISNVRNMDKMLKGSSISGTNMDETLKYWANKTGTEGYTPNLDLGNSEIYDINNINNLENYGWNIEGNYTQIANAIGDPYIKPLYGLMYKIPDIEASYRLYQSKNGKVSINGKVEKYKDIDKLNEKVKEINKTRFEEKLNLKHLMFPDMYFFTKVVIKINGPRPIAYCYNLEEEKWENEINNTQNINIIETKKEIGDLNELYNSEKVNMIKIKIETCNLTLKFYKCDNPQIHTGLEIIQEKGRPSQGQGLLIHECISETCKTENIYDFEHKNIIKARKDDGKWIKEQFFTNNGEKNVKCIRIL